MGHEQQAAGVGGVGCPWHHRQAASACQQPHNRTCLLIPLASAPPVHLAHPAHLPHPHRRPRRGKLGAQHTMWDAPVLMRHTIDSMDKSGFANITGEQHMAPPMQCHGLRAIAFPLRQPAVLRHVWHACLAQTGGATGCCFLRTSSTPQSARPAQDACCLLPPSRSCVRCAHVCGPLPRPGAPALQVQEQAHPAAVQGPARVAQVREGWPGRVGARLHASIWLRAVRFGPLAGLAVLLG